MNKLAFIAIALSIVLLSKAQQGGYAAFLFLEHNNSAVAGMLGSKNISNLSSLELVFFNPALLDSSKNNNLSISYQRHLAGIQAGEIIYAMPEANFGHLAIGIHYIDYGQFDAYNELGQNLGKFSASEKAPYLVYSLDLDSNVRVGITFKAILSNLERYTAYGYALDFGLLVKISQNLHAALVIRNYGKQLKPYFSTIEPLPFNILLGFTGKFKYSPLRFNVTFDQLNRWNLRYDSPIESLYVPVGSDSTQTLSLVGKLTDQLLRHTHLGLEVLLSEHFIIAVGYNYRRGKELALPVLRTLNGLSFGLSLNTSKVRFNYALEQYQRFAIHNFGMELRLNSIFKFKRKTN